MVSGREEMVGAEGVVLGAAADGASPGWWAEVHGERWKAVSTAPLAPGQRVRVTGCRGLTLDVEPLAAAVAEQGAS